MLFNTLVFWPFFLLVLAVNYGGPRNFSRAWLVLASFAFYASWGLALTPLLAACILVNYGFGLLIGRSRGSRAKVAVGAAIAVNLAILGFFKYYPFVVQTLSRLIDIPAAAKFDLALPVAISFYTFEAIAYNVDVYRRQLEPRKSLLDFALFLSFFPHLVAGPIIRPALFFPQVVGRPAPTGEGVRWGTLQILKGLLKKAIFADNFALIANPYFNTGLGHSDALTAWVAVLAFAMQIYFDFSGYTDIARGCATLLGYEFPPNFERPYLAANIAEFWRRWHISLSTWLRDYLYFPLGGNRRGKARTYLNLLITMGLGGLWHGASWNFVVWGLYHGVLLAAYRLWSDARPIKATPSALRRAASIALTFFVVTLGWVTFRTASFGDTMAVYFEMFAGGLKASAAPPLGFLALAGFAAGWVALDRERRVQHWLVAGAQGLALLRLPVAIAVTLLAIELCAPTGEAVPFLYFRF